MGASMSDRGLGEQLKAVRELKGLSLAAVAGPAEMSATYLQKLERGEVESPSPHRLHRLADVLDVDYSDLMGLAGYVVPRTESNGNAPGGSLLAQALSAEELTEEELSDLAEYLAFKRQQARRRT
jgi:transcriptional regulator with XRE-family HTH domain